MLRNCRTLLSGMTGLLLQLRLLQLSPAAKPRTSAAKRLTPAARRLTPEPPLTPTAMRLTPAAKSLTLNRL